MPAVEERRFWLFSLALLTLECRNDPGRWQWQYLRYTQWNDISEFVAFLLPFTLWTIGSILEFHTSWRWCVSTNHITRAIITTLSFFITVPTWCCQSQLSQHLSLAVVGGPVWEWCIILLLFDAEMHEICLLESSCVTMFYLSVFFWGARMFAEVLPR